MNRLLKNNFQPRKQSVKEDRLGKKEDWVTTQTRLNQHNPVTKSKFKAGLEG